MKSSTASPATEFVFTLWSFVRTHSGPAPSINSTLRESVHGFLNRRSVSHSVEWRRKSGVTPASISSQFSIGVNSTAKDGPKLDEPSWVFQLAAPPNSTTAAGSFSADCAKAHPDQSSKHVISPNFVARTRWSPPCSDLGSVFGIGKMHGFELPSQENQERTPHASTAVSLLTWTESANSIVVLNLDEAAGEREGGTKCSM